MLTNLETMQRAGATYRPSRGWAHPLHDGRSMMVIVMLFYFLQSAACHAPRKKNATPDSDTAVLLVRPLYTAERWLRLLSEIREWCGVMMPLSFSVRIKKEAVKRGVWKGLLLHWSFFFSWMHCQCMTNMLICHLVSKNNLAFSFNTVTF